MGRPAFYLTTGYWAKFINVTHFIYHYFISKTTLDTGEPLRVLFQFPYVIKEVSYCSMSRLTVLSFEKKYNLLIANIFAVLLYLKQGMNVFAQEILNQ